MAIMRVIARHLQVFHRDKSFDVGRETSRYFDPA
uniref:Uncharacterized protein n=1 Tax=Arundo donax TaxID=35708 RepID=A0A0A8Z8T6_ARUDO